MVKKATIFLVLIIFCLAGCSTEDKSVDVPTSEQTLEKIVLDDITKSKNTSIINGNAHYGTSVIIGDGKEIGYFDINTQKYTPFFELSYGMVHQDKVTDIAVSFQDEDYLVVTQFEERTIDSMVLYPKKYFIFDKKDNKLIRELENTQKISDEEKISGYIPLTVYTQDNFIIESQDANTKKLALFTYNFSTEKFDKLVDNACLPKYFDNALYYVDRSNPEAAIIMKSNDWSKPNDMNSDIILKNSVIEDFQVLESNQIALIKSAKNTSHYELMVDNKVVDEAMVNSAMLSVSKNKTVLDYYYDDKVRVYSLDSKDVEILREGNQVSNISISDDQVVWQELDADSSKEDEKRILYVYNLN
ncbi:hypothetical protein HB830_02500 [Listeria innocua]|uniref:hypothetical protein n=1 Tax=Listeria innocua TaxID=1642 RepID=UPI00162A2586|nr:hypothetical protein [Listeria innocua]MBC1392255.1 hypothetical protein [Listeria innocua]